MGCVLPNSHARWAKKRCLCVLFASGRVLEWNADREFLTGRVIVAGRKLKMNGTDMLWALQIIAEERIQESMRNGEFDNLQGMGKPLALEDESHIPQELRMSYKILKNSGCLPPEIEERKEIQQAKDLLAGMTDEQERFRQMEKLNLLIMKANMKRRRPIALEEQQVYFEKAVSRVSVEKKDK